MKKIICAGVVGMLCLATQAMGVSHYTKGACQSDAQKFCKNVKPGEGRIGACLKSHHDELSPDCKANYEKMKAIHSACETDRQKFCSSIPEGKGEVVKCLKQHKKELSKECRTSLKHKK